MLVLNIDDDIDDREMFCEALKVIDSIISFVGMESGSKALEFLSTTEILPDYIFIDINMPKMDGYECVEEIRSITRMNKIPIVMYSTAFNPRDQDNFTKLGIKYLIKSSQFSKLVTSIKTLIFNDVTELEGESKK